MKSHIWHSLAFILQFCLGVFFTALAFPLFFIGNQIAPGGVTGIATVINHLSGIPVGLLAILMNLPLFAISIRRMGRVFATRSFVAMISVSLIIDLLPVPQLTDDTLLAALSGGALVGMGLGLVLRAGATTGGTDMTAKMIHHYYPTISVGAVLLAIDCLVIALAGLVFEPQAALYSVIAVFVSTRVMDQLVEGFNTAKAFFIISQHHDVLAKQILSNLDRGVTILHGQGAYSGEGREVLLCVVRRVEILPLKRLVASTDPQAFVIVTDVTEAMGEGFKTIHHS